MTPQYLQGLEMPERIAAVCALSNDEIANYANEHCVDLPRHWVAVVTSMAFRLIDPESYRADKYRPALKEFLEQHS